VVDDFETTERLKDRLLLDNEDKTDVFIDAEGLDVLARWNVNALRSIRIPNPKRGKELRLSRFQRVCLQR